MTFDEQMIAARNDVEKLDSEIASPAWVSAGNKHVQSQFQIELMKVRVNLLIAQALNRIASRIR